MSELLFRSKIVHKGRKIPLLNTPLCDSQDIEAATSDPKDVTCSLCKKLMHNEEEVPCRWCEKPTRMLGTKECDNCHEIRVRIGVNRRATLKMVVAMEKGEL